MRHLTLLLALCALSLPVFGQCELVRGVVLDAETGAPISSMTIQFGENEGVTTSTAGRFSLPCERGLDGRLTVSGVGYQSQDVVIEPASQHIIVRMMRSNTIIPEIVVEQASITGGFSRIKDLSGSAHYLGPREIARFQHQDVNRALQAVPGVYLQEEDGYGLRPNVGMRGTGVERSSKITLMEDGILMAPAPYAASAAYYFPTMGRMDGIEVRKGSSQIKYGPYTTGGALNLLSTPIPDRLSGRVHAFAGGDRARTLQADFGHSFKNGAFLLETYQMASDGFKKLDNDGSTGFEKQDYLLKARINTDTDLPIVNTLSFKAGRTNEVSDETYLGLTESDFEREPLRRYAGSQMDQMTTEHQQLRLQHSLRTDYGLTITSTVYRNDFERDWFKLDKVQVAGRASVGISSLLENPMDHPDAMILLQGGDQPDGGLFVKHNNRAYVAQGIQTILALPVSSSQDIELGARYHYDEMDRFQWIDEFGMSQGSMQLVEAGVPGTDSNRIESARALAFFGQYRGEFGRFSFTPGLRFESIEVSRDDYGKADPDRTGSAMTSRSNPVNALIPGVSVGYRVLKDLRAYVGIHRGFAPPGSTEGSEPESSINYELGFKLDRGLLSAEVNGFYNDYSNLLGADLVAAGGEGSNDQFNGGAVTVRGLEMAIAQDLGAWTGWRLSLPVSLTYTLSDGRFDTAFESTFDAWGTVEKGDALPYLPTQQWTATAGVQTQRADFFVRANYSGAMRTVAGQGPITASQATDERIVLDAAANFEVTSRVSLFGKISNLTDAVYVVARRPAGLRPGMPRRASAGLKVNW